MKKLTEIRDKILRIADGAWSMDIIDGDKIGNDWIDQFIRSDSGLHWSWEDPYRFNGQFAWCGAFATYCYRAAGFKSDLARHYGSSTYRWARYAKYQDPPGSTFNGVLTQHMDHDPTYIRSYNEPSDCEIEPGDILLINFTGKRSYGDHVAIAASPAKHGSVATFEGNAKGWGPDWKIREGVIYWRRSLVKSTNWRKHGVVCKVIKPSPLDFE